MERPKIRLLGSSIVLATIILASLALPVQATYPGANGRIVFGRFDYPDLGLYDFFTANPDGSHGHIQIFPVRPRGTLRSD